MKIHCQYSWRILNQKTSGSDSTNNQTEKAKEGIIIIIVVEVIVAEHC